MEIHDSFNNQFKLHNYLANLNNNLLQYFENNNLDVNYYCFFSKIVDNVHYIITSATKKRKNNGCRLINISCSEANNNIYYCENFTIIYFEGMCIKISELINDINEHIKILDIKVVDFDESALPDGVINCYHEYNSDVLEDNVTEILRVNKIEDFNLVHNLQNLKKLTFSCSYDQTISKNMLPDSLQTLTFGHYYNQIIGENVLPNSLQTLIFGRCYRQTISKNMLPNSLQTLTFGRDYNQIIGKNVLPNSLQTLTFGSHYNQIIGKNVLPNSLQTLTFSHDYNQIINDNVLPNALQTLTLTVNYNQIIRKNVLPLSLKNIIFKYYFDDLYCNHYSIPHEFQIIVQYVKVNR
jgi:hypothetical protein